MCVCASVTHMVHYTVRRLQGSLLSLVSEEQSFQFVAKIIGSDPNTCAFYHYLHICMKISDSEFYQAMIHYKCYVAFPIL